MLARCWAPPRSSKCRLRSRRIASSTSSSWTLSQVVLHASARNAAQIRSLPACWRMDVPVDSREVSLGIPAKPEYLVLVRLALSAVCRLTPLGPDEVADLKLAVTEAATTRVRADAPRQAENQELRVRMRRDADR